MKLGINNNMKSCHCRRVYKQLGMLSFFKQNPCQTANAHMKKKSRKSGLLQTWNFQFVQSSKIKKKLSPNLSVY